MSGVKKRGRDILREPIIIFAIIMILMTPILLAFRSEIVDREEIQLRGVSELAQNNTKAISLFNTTAEKILTSIYDVRHNIIGKEGAQNITTRLDALVNKLDNVSNRLSIVEKGEINEPFRSKS